MISSWDEFFLKTKDKDYAKRLHALLDKEYASYQCFPPRSLMFNAFSLTDPKTLKAVIIGQDPYHRFSAPYERKYEDDKENCRFR